ncbi:MAG: hypothetical protein IJO28_01475 [Oscillospiraceae bacterium]|nr:hypothetical protein [Oscillospiraceae bacterium]
MENNKNRYKELEKYMTIILIALAVLFLVYLIAAGTGIIWLKVLTAIIDIFVGLLCLVYLYLTKLIFAPRSLWMTFAAGSVVICTLFSLILNFPSVL